MITREIAQAHYPSRPLGDVADFLDNRRKPVKKIDRIPGPYPYYGANGQQGTINGYLFDEPLLLLAEDGGLFDEPDRGIAYRVSGKTWVNNHAHVIRPKNGLDMGFLYRTLENYDVRPYINGSTRSKLTKTQASQIVIPLPPLKEQKRIAAILDQADALRAARQRALDKLNTLGQSIFYDMFGDELKHCTHGETIHEYVKFITSGGRGWAKYYAPTGARFIRSLDVQMNRIGSDDVVYVAPPKNAEARRTKINKRDVLLTITGSKIGRVAVAPEDIEGAYISQHVAIIRLDLEKINPIFLSFYLSLEEGGQRQIRKLQYGQAKPGLNFEQIRSFEMPKIDIVDQIAFCARLYEVNGLNSKLEKGLAEQSQFFASLQQRAFRGEL